MVEGLVGVANMNCVFIKGMKIRAKRGFKTIKCEDIVRLEIQKKPINEDLIDQYDNQCTACGCYGCGLYKEKWAEVGRIRKARRAA